MGSPAAVANKLDLYRSLLPQLKALLEGETDFVANAANTSALLADALPDVNWVGFYVLDGKELRVGPFQGKPACVRIPLGRGVCGTAAARREPLVVSNVHEFDDHIVCDTASNSELVLPLIRDGELFGVLDVDSAELDRFDDVDVAGLQRLMEVFVDSLGD